MNETEERARQYLAAPPTLYSISVVRLHAVVEPAYPVIVGDEYRAPLIEEIKPQPGKFRKFCKTVFEIFLWMWGVCLVFVILRMIFGH